MSMSMNIIFIVQYNLYSEVYKIFSNHIWGGGRTTSLPAIYIYIYNKFDGGRLLWPETRNTFLGPNLLSNKNEIGRSGNIVHRTPNKNKNRLSPNRNPPINYDQGIDKLWHDGSQWKEFQFAQLHS